MTKPSTGGRDSGSRGVDPARKPSKTSGIWATSRWAAGEALGDRLELSSGKVSPGSERCSASSSTISGSVVRHYMRISSDDNRRSSLPRWRAARPSAGAVVARQRGVEMLAKQRGEVVFAKVFDEVKRASSVSHSRRFRGSILLERTAHREGEAVEQRRRRDFGRAEVEEIVIGAATISLSAFCMNRPRALTTTSSDDGHRTRSGEAEADDSGESFDEGAG